MIQKKEKRRRERDDKNDLEDKTYKFKYKNIPKKSKNKLNSKFIKFMSIFLFN